MSNNQPIVTLEWTNYGKFSDLDKKFPAGDDPKKADKIAGVYIWILKDSEIFYVGESTNVWGKRLEQEIIDLLGGAWPTYDLSKVSSTFKEFLINNVYNENTFDGFWGVRRDYYMPARQRYFMVNARAVSHHY